MSEINPNLEEKIREIVREEIDKQDSNKNVEDVQEKVSKKLDTSKSEKTKISRRNFLKTLGLGAGGLALTSNVFGASLMSGSTIGGNTVWHQGNDGKNSGLVAEKAASVPVYQSESDLPAGSTGDIAYVQNKGSLYVEDGS